MLPASIKLMAFRAKRPTDDPHLWCTPMGVPRTTPYPFRFVQNYTDGSPTHLFILLEATIHTYRQIFMDGRSIRSTRSDLVRPSIGRFDGKTRW